ncbi:hypothetical protein SK128_026992 [Halocaridina rubra]|uniref:Uncharacterized protein n=1 Tax=Halocaridina rubra TaxID=373956 RepID=A0AAN9A1F3_HALRR
MIVRIVAMRGCDVLRSTPLRHNALLCNRFSPTLTLVNPRMKSTKKTAEEEIDLDEPIKFSTSPAASWRTRETYSGQSMDSKTPWLPLQIHVRLYSTHSSSVWKKQVACVLKHAGWPQSRLHVRYVNDWHRRADQVLRSNRQLIITITLGVFLGYFLMLRQPSNIDEFLSRPIWERLPGIDPERAEHMMLVDKSMGLQVDMSGLEEYRKKYYAEKSVHLEAEVQAEKKHRELRETMGSHQDMLRAYSERRQQKD